MCPAHGKNWGLKRGNFVLNRFIKIVGRVVPILIIALLSFSISYAQERLRLATTTSTENSGLLYALVPPFEKMFNVKVDIIPVGSGKAIQLGRSGDVDVILVHDPISEEKFIAQGWGINRREVMYNDFIIIGPKTDPVHIRGIKRASEAFAKIAKMKYPFLSRGDESGTHKKEISLWNDAHIQPGGSWYYEVGQGMGAVIKMAHEKMAYTLADRGTYLIFRDKINLVALLEGDNRLFNPYSVIAINPAKFPHVNYIKAMAFIGWLTSREGQGIIKDFAKDRFGQPIFIPMAISAP